MAYVVQSSLLSDKFAEFNCICLLSWHDMEQNTFYLLTLDGEEIWGRKNLPVQGSPVKMCQQQVILPPSVNFWPLTPHWTSLGAL